MIREFCYQRIIISIPSAQVPLILSHARSHTLAKSHTHTRARFIFNSGTSCRSMHVHSLLCERVNVCALCVSRFVWRDQRYLCRRDRTDNPFVTKLSNHLFMGWYPCLGWNRAHQGQRVRAGERGGWQRQTKSRSRYEGVRKYLCLSTYKYSNVQYHSIPGSPYLRLCLSRTELNGMQMRLQRNLGWIWPS